MSGMLHRFLFFAITLLILLFPSFSIIEEIWVPAPWKIENDLTIGSMIHLPRIPHTPPPMIKGEVFSPSPRGDQWWGVIGIDPSEFTLINGKRKVGNYFFRPQIEAYRILLHIHNGRANRVARLQIPSSVWKKMDRKFSQQKIKERNEMSEILASRRGTLPSHCMTSPLRSKAKIVSRFASARRLPNGRTYQHTGIDLRAAKGTPVKAIASGTIAYASKMIVPGNVVVIDHGGGLFSRYFHLSKIMVKKGSRVKKGQEIGLSGATGRVEAPHLHWEVVWKGSHANPRRFLRDWERICDQS